MPLVLVVWVGWLILDVGWFQNTVTLGSAALGIIGTLAVVVGIVYGVRYKVAYEAASAAADELRKSIADERDRVGRLEGVIAQTREQLTSAQTTIARLEQLPDLAAIVGLLDKHEIRAQERHEATTEVLTALTARIVTT